MQLHTPFETKLPLDESIRRHVQQQTNGMIQNLNVRVLSEHVELTGQADSYYAKQLATHAALHIIDDLMELTNGIEVG